MEALPKIVRKRLQKGPVPGVHPEADMLTAFAEKLLSEPERIQVMEHLAQCEHCREVVFLSAPEQAPTQVVGKIPSRAGWLSWPALRWGAAVACVAIVGTAVTTLHHQSQSRLILSEQTADGKAQSAATVAPPEAVAPAATRNPSAEIKYEAAPPDKDAKDSAEDKLVAKLEPPAPQPSRKAMTATPAVPMQFDQSAQINGNEVRVDGSMGARTASNMAAAPPSNTLDKVVNSETQTENGQKQLQTGVVSQAVTVTSQNEVVEVEASPVPVTKSKDASVAELPLNGREFSSLQTMPTAALTAGVMRQDSSNSEKTKEKKKEEDDRASTKSTPRWMLTPDGVLQRSLNDGKTWESVPVDGKASFQTYAAVGMEIWAGGAHGLLFHSSDAGRHWVRMRPRAYGLYLTAGITHIEFSDTENGKLTTTTGEIWTTTDTGQTWQK